MTLLGPAMSAQDTSKVDYRLTLEQCLDFAFGNNNDRQVMKLSEDINEESYKQSKAERLPSLSASLSESFNNSKENSSYWNGNYGLNTSVTLYKGGSITNTIEQNKLTMEQSGYQTKKYDNGLTIQILQSFLTILGNEELLKSQESVLKASEAQLVQGKAQFEAGQILESDYLLLEAQYANDKNNITDTQIARDNSLLTLKSLLSMNPLETLEIVRFSTEALNQMAVLPTKEHVLEQAIVTLPELKISQYDVDIAKVGIKLSKAGYLPTLSLGASVGTGHYKDYNSFGTQLSDGLNEQIGLTLSIPIYDNGRTKSNVAQSKIRLQQAELNKKQTELDILQTVIQEYQDVVSNYNKYQTTDIRQNAYLKTYEAYRAQFNAGAITAVDLLQQQNNYINALNDFIQSKYSFMLTRKILDVYMGMDIKM